MFYPNKKTLGYSLISMLISISFLGIMGLFILSGLAQWKENKILEQDIKKIYLSLEFASAEASLNQRIFILAEGNHLSVLQDVNKNKIPDAQDLVLHEIFLDTKDINLVFKAFGNPNLSKNSPKNSPKNTWITLEPKAQDAFQNFTLNLIKNNKILSKNIRMNTAGDIKIN